VTEVDHEFAICCCIDITFELYRFKVGLHILTANPTGAWAGFAL